MEQTKRQAPRRSTEERQLERSYEKIAGKRRTPKRDRKNMTILWVAIAAVLVLIGILVAVFLFIQTKNAVIPKNLWVAGVDVGGMSRSQAEKAIKREVGGAYELTDMEVTMMDKSVVISPKVSGARLDVSGAVSGALKYGKKGLFVKAQVPEERTDLDLSPYLSLDKEAVQEVLNGLAFTFDTGLTQSTYEVTGEMPSLTDPNDNSKQMILTVHKGTPEYSLDLDVLYDDVMKAYSRRDFQPTVDCPRIEPDDLDLFAIYKQYCKDPVDATMDPVTFAVTPETYGYGFDVEAVYKQIAETPYGETLTVPFTHIAPQAKGEDLSGTLYKDTLANYSAAGVGDGSRNANLAAAAKLLNQQILLPDEIFSFNRLVQPTSGNGFRNAGSCDGSTVMGGGICVVSGSLYYCALQADLEIIEHHFHRYAQPDIPLGFDAHVSFGSDDLQFKNNTGAPIRIEVSTSGSNVTVTLMGTDSKDYTITPEAKTLRSMEYNVTYQSLAPGNQWGFRDGDVIQQPLNGYEVATYRTKTAKSGSSDAVRITEESVTYESKDKIICSIVS